MEVDQWSFVVARLADSDLEGLNCRNKTVGDMVEGKGVSVIYELPKELIE